MIAPRRAGFSLMEMLVATAILLVAVGVLSELAYIGTRHADRAEAAATAQRMCQNILEEILSGGRPLESVSDAATSESSEWHYSVEIKPLERFRWSPGLAELRVTVVPASEGAESGRSVSLSRWIRYVSPETQEDGSLSRQDIVPDAPHNTPLSGGARP